MLINVSYLNNIIPTSSVALAMNVASPLRSSGRVWRSDECTSTHFGYRRTGDCIGSADISGSDTTVFDTRQAFDQRVVAREAKAVLEVSCSRSIRLLCLAEFRQITCHSGHQSRRIGRQWACWMCIPSWQVAELKCGTNGRGDDVRVVG